MVAHHAEFDMSFLEKAAADNEMERINLPWICTLNLAREIFDARESLKLNSLCSRLKIKIKEPFADIIATAECFLELKRLRSNNSSRNSKIN